MSLYDVLEIKSCASEIEIRKAYYKLAKLYHPDKNDSPESTERFQQIQTAYEILINDKTRLEYLKLKNEEKLNFTNIYHKIINDNLNMDDIYSFANNIKKTDLSYIKNNFKDFFKNLNIKELLDLVTNGTFTKKQQSYDCSDSEDNIFDESNAEYCFYLPIKFKKHNHLDIVINKDINISHINMNKSIKSKIQIKRKIEDEDVISTFIYTISSPHIIFIGGGDMEDGEYGNLIINLNLPESIIWNEDKLIVEKTINLYQLIYGLDIYIDLGNSNNISIKEWIPKRDGYIININNNIVLKLVLDYHDTEDKHTILKEYFSN